MGLGHGYFVVKTAMLMPFSAKKLAGRPTEKLSDFIQTKRLFSTERPLKRITVDLRGPNLRAQDLVSFFHIILNNSYTEQPVLAKLTLMLIISKMSY